MLFLYLKRYRMPGYWKSYLIQEEPNSSPSPSPSVSISWNISFRLQRLPLAIYFILYMYFKYFCKIDIENKCSFQYIYFWNKNELDVDFKAMFGSSLPPVVYRRDHVLFTLFVFAQWCPPFFFFVFVLCTQYYKFLWIVQSWLPLQFSITFI